LTKKSSFESRKFDKAAAVCMFLCISIHVRLDCFDDAHAIYDGSLINGFNLIGSGKQRKMNWGITGEVNTKS
jgi:hypothetical protein